MYFGNPIHSYEIPLLTSITNFPIASPNTRSLPDLNPSNLPFLPKSPLFSLHPRPQFLTSRPPKCQNLHAPQQHPHPQQQQQLPPDQLADAQAAISQFLPEFGVAPLLSISIASKSPKYAKMLIYHVKDSDEWNAWKNGSDEIRDLGFKEKMIFMAKEKGDNGKVAFLESVGLSLSSAMNAARYLSRDSLPSVIYKVNYMKELFFSDSVDKALVGKNARRMMMNLSIPTDEDLQQTLSFFEKIEARRGGLDILGSADASFRFLIESFPRILLLPIDSHMRPMIEYLESIGVPIQHMGQLFLLFPPIIFYGNKNMKTKIMAYEKLGAIDKDFSTVLLKYPWILSTCVQDNYKEILSFFEMEKVAKVSVDRAIRSLPRMLGCSTSKLEVMVEQFGDFGIRNKLGQVISTSPQLLLRKPQEFIRVVSFLEELGFDREAVGKILCRSPEIFATNIDKTLKKKVEFLASIGICNYLLPQVIRKYPELLVYDVNRTLLPRMKYLMEVGFSKRDIVFMVCGFSPLLGYSIDEVLRPKCEFLVNTMKKPVEDVVDYPRYFSYSLEEKIKPRFWVLKGRNVECSLKDMLHKNDEEFTAEFM